MADNSVMRTELGADDGLAKPSSFVTTSEETNIILYQNIGFGDTMRSNFKAQPHHSCMT